MLVALLNLFLPAVGYASNAIGIHAREKHSVKVVRISIPLMEVLDEMF